MDSPVINTLDYLFDEIPDPGSVMEVAEGVKWVRMPLPFQLNHINLWLIDDGDGWTMVDTGINSTDVMDVWRKIFTDQLDGKPIKRLICTHAHPDHMGLAGWICKELNVEMTTTQGEWVMGRLFSIGGTQEPEVYQGFLRSAGCDENGVDAGSKQVLSAKNLYQPVPHRYQRIRAGDKIAIGGHDWEVMIGYGHAFEHACLYCADLGVLIGGDQFLPKITPLVMLQPHDPHTNALGEFLSSIQPFRHLPQDTVVLPSHNTPFRGLEVRIDQYEAHHAERLETTLRACASSATVYEVGEVLFPKASKEASQLFFVIGETLAHLRYLEIEDRVTRTMGDDGVISFQAK